MCRPRHGPCRVHCGCRPRAVTLSGRYERDPDSHSAPHSVLVASWRTRSAGCPPMSELPVVDVGPLAGGGHCVARLDGQVVFVRHTLPGERARIRITERRKKYLRADAIEIIRASEHRITPACPYAGRCGGCDFQHVNSAHQRELLAGIVAEHMARIAKIDVDVRIEAADPDDYAWRTRSEFAVAPDGRLGFRAHRSHEVVPVEECRIASANHPAVLKHKRDASCVLKEVNTKVQRDDT